MSTASLDDDGWTVVPHLLTDEEVATIRRSCHELLSLPAGRREARDKPASGTRHLAELDRRLPLVASVLDRPAIRELVGSLLGERHEPGQVEFRSPRPGFGGQQLHADDPPKLHDGPATVATAIIALVDFTPRNGATSVLPGSHRRPDLQRRSGSLGSHPEAITVTCSAGDAVLFSGHLLHAGTRNDADHEREAIQVVWRRSAATS
ncbi:MAG: phytanoyl-CoA dioxygenase family protein [Actinomycetota bacterium]